MPSPAPPAPRFAQILTHQPCPRALSNLRAALRLSPLSLWCLQRSVLCLNRSDVHMLASPPPVLRVRAAHSRSAAALFVPGAVSTAPAQLWGREQPWDLISS